MVFTVNGAAPSGETVDANYIWEVYETISDGADFDSLDGVGDSLDLLTKHTFEPGWQYILVVGEQYEECANELIVRIHCLDATGTILYTVADIDTLVDAGDAVLLPIGETAFGHKFTLQLLGGAAQSNVGGVEEAYIYRRRCITGTQARWR